MHNTPLVSVIMPAYSCEETILQSVHSALAQTIENIEVIIVDDCSTDRTAEIIAELAADSRVRALKNPVNSGVAATRNYAIRMASGAFLAFLDSDDLWEPMKLKKQLELMNNTGCGLCYSSYDYFRKDHRTAYRAYLVPETIDYDGLLKENVIGLSTVVLRKSVLFGGMQFDTNLFHEDFALWLKLLRNGVTARGLPEVLAHNKTGGRSSNKWKSLRNRWHIYRKSEGMPRLTSCRYLAFYAMAGLRKYRK